MTQRFTILGCGSSGGVPRLGGHWGACDRSEPKNRRQRCSLLVEQDGPEGTTQVLIDTTPDMRNQLLDANVGRLDGVVFTHAHADHCHGIDDLRMIVINMRERLQIWADGGTRKNLEHRFDYVFVQPEWSSYPPILQMNEIDGPFKVDGPGGPIEFTPLRVDHGDIEALGFRVGNVAYLPDVSHIPDATWDLLEGLDIWILDSLRYAPHPSHANVETALAWIEKAKPARAVLTNMHNDLDYATLSAEVPETVTLAFDGRVLTV